ncbi:MULTISPECIES: hypothetical protein [unclassified Flavobacterium]|uniref:hypothetical protein n=1 Tax=unclassified Flavobacterium TaxID=196869 RepID=UPI0026214D92|nr:hypothetical protein [Flavobacterium sp.]
MEKTQFDKEFQRLTTEMVEVAFEYVGRNSEEVDHVYIYASMEYEIFFYNVFYQINNIVVKKELVNNVLHQKADDSDDRIDALLSIGGHALMDLSDVFSDDGRELPTLLKMVYSPKTGGFDCDVLYENYGNDPDWSNVSALENWYQEVTNKM